MLLITEKVSVFRGLNTMRRSRKKLFNYPLEREDITLRNCAQRPRIYAVGIIVIKKPGEY
jgi:hypothetical protein